MPQISTGDIMRSHRERATDLGRKIAPIMESGRLVPDELVLTMVQERLREDDCQLGFVLDGFPRTVAQGQWLDQFLASEAVAGTVWGMLGKGPVVILIDVGYNQLLQRLTG